MIYSCLGALNFFFPFGVRFASVEQTAQLYNVRPDMRTGTLCLFYINVEWEVGEARQGFIFAGSKLATCVDHIFIVALAYFRHKYRCLAGCDSLHCWRGFLFKSKKESNGKRCKCSDREEPRNEPFCHVHHRGIRDERHPRDFQLLDSFRSQRYFFLHILILLLGVGCLVWFLRETRLMQAGWMRAPTPAACGSCLPACPWTCRPQKWGRERGTSM